MMRPSNSPTRPDWPEAELEHLGHCPVCGHAPRQEIYRGIGRPNEPLGWTLWRCLGCRSGYIDPRPDLASVGRLYGTYYTHVSADHDGAESAGVRQRLLDGYLQSRYGYALRPFLPARVVPLVPGGRGMASQHVRDLDVPSPGARLLDVGCANGAFLVRMRGLGWDVSGLEVDPVSAGYARAAGIPVVEEPLTESTFPPEHFDAITLSHVIEHLHDPMAVLRACAAALRPGGRIWIATPNLDAASRRVLQRIWVALDPPRHLVLFNRRSLRDALASTGFVDADEPPPTLQASRWTFGASIHVEEGGDGRTVRPLPTRRRLQALAVDAATVVSRSAGEEICMTAVRSGA
jgi:SAM-dependent methyltransferase